jgi:hypothetical protein
MPVTMFTPGYEDENKVKPELTLKIEESDGGLTAEKAAEGLYEGASPPFFDCRTESDYIRRREKGRLPHYGYAHRRFVSNEHPWVITVRVKRPQRPTFRGYRHGTSSCIFVDKCKSYLTRVDWPRAVAERCGQASGEAQKGTLRVSNIEGYIDRVISFYKDTTAQDLGPVKIPMEGIV